MSFLKVFIPGVILSALAIFIALIDYAPKISPVGSGPEYFKITGLFVLGGIGILLFSIILGTILEYKAEGGMGIRSTQDKIVFYLIIMLIFLIFLLNLKFNFLY